MKACNFASHRWRMIHHRIDCCNSRVMLFRQRLVHQPSAGSESSFQSPRCRRPEDDFMRRSARGCEVKKSGEPVPGVRRAITCASGAARPPRSSWGSPGAPRGFIRARARPHRARRGLLRASTGSYARRQLAPRRRAGIRPLGRAGAETRPRSARRTRTAASARDPRGNTRLGVNIMTPYSNVLLGV